MNLLPSLRNHLKELFISKRTRYKLAIVLDLILIVFILITGKTPAQRMMTPLVSSVKTYYSVSQHKTTKESFAFVPGLARNKFSDVDLSGLTNLSFFDVPVTDDGQLNRDSRGYASFTSGEASELFDRARYQKTKIFMTLSATAPDTVRTLLDDSGNPERLAQDAAAEINDSNIAGVTIDFEYTDGQARQYQEKLTNFMHIFTKKMHELSPQSLVAVAVPNNSVDNNSLYNIEALGKNSDRIFLIASDFIVPESKNGTPVNPVFGYNSNDYWVNVSSLISNLEQRIPANKLVMERAWYGNGDNYPLYVPANTGSSEAGKGSSNVELDQGTIDTLLAGVPAKGQVGARKNIPLIAQALSDEGILDSSVLAYALGTIEHETDETFEPIGEIQGTFSARRLGYEGGADYYGRGFIQITHLRNYREIGQRIGMGDQLVRNPDLASSPKVAAKVLAAFFKDNNVANLASQGNFVAARRPVNPDYNGYSVANLAMKYELY